MMLSAVTTVGLLETRAALARNLKSTCTACAQVSKTTQEMRLTWGRQASALYSVSATSRVADKKLFTPGPLQVSLTVKEAMLRDLGSRDTEFVNTVKSIRSHLLQIAGVTEKTFTCVPIQGSGTFAVEAVLQTSVPRKSSKVLILQNGAYGKRMGKICDVASIPYHMEDFPENSIVEPSRVSEILKENSSFTHVSIVHCETSSGVFNPVEEVGKIVKTLAPGTVYFVDAMSSFGAVPLDVEASQIDFLVSSANKCLQGVPGFSYAIARKSALEKCKGNARSYTLDLYDQNEGLDKSGQFRFTPATHAMLAFQQALSEFEEEGGVAGRARRYKENQRIIAEGMRRLGFKELLEPSVQGYIITSYYYPSDPNFNFTEFYNRLNDKDQVIYPGKTLDTDCFRIGNIGHLFPEDMRRLIQCIEEVCHDMKMRIPVRN
ncbi:uncharacterized protein LOC112570876 [Pomacea canaliculata]|uniref:uncharacterized protein LOC112570876 n=1 Tax=Pomacea canaliculata TaxID=400727 RepID=UPI000D73F752|nr:uncharacterized protein LOC112570876 [Pomacea canaliculata]